ncbi:hypothetical protein D3C86_1147930 [compost metagenome]
MVQISHRNIRNIRACFHINLDCSYCCLRSTSVVTGMSECQSHRISLVAYIGCIAWRVCVFVEKCSGTVVRPGRNSILSSHTCDHFCSSRAKCILGGSDLDGRWTIDLESISCKAVCRNTGVIAFHLHGQCYCTSGFNGRRKIGRSGGGWIGDRT